MGRAGGGGLGDPPRRGRKMGYRKKQRSQGDNFDPRHADARSLAVLRTTAGFHHGLIDPVQISSLTRRIVRLRLKILFERYAFGVVTPLVARQEERPACKN